MTLSILVPVLNEETLIVEFLKSLDRTIKSVKDKDVTFQVIVSDGGSQDSSWNLIQSFCEENSWVSVQTMLANPSVGQTLARGQDFLEGDVCVFLPCDCRLSGEALRELMTLASSRRRICGGFFKDSSGEGYLMGLYVFLQNQIRFKFLKNLVWTNGIFMSRSIYKKVIIPDEGFLEDVMLSDHLRANYHVSVIKNPIGVSWRRYHNRCLRRIGLNLMIVFLYRIGYRNILILKKLYLSLK